MVYLVGAIISDKYSIRFKILAPMALVSTVGYIILCATANTGAQLFATFLCGAGIYICVGLHFTWLGRECTPSFDDLVQRCFAEHDVL